MPKTAMTQAEIEKVRGKILDTALDIIIDEGFDSLSVRKIASRLGITATTIYNYYKNKDELNLMIRVRGFQKLYELMTKRSAVFIDIQERIGAMIRAVIEFGLAYPSYYDIMFSLRTPKYLDYVGTENEQLAYEEKQNALKCLALFIEPLNAYVPGDKPGKDEFVLYQVVKFWSDIHGLITLYNSRLLHEVLDDVNAFLETRTLDLIDTVLQIKARVDMEELLF